MRTSLGQNTHSPGHGKGFVSTVTGATPLSVRTGFVRSFSMKRGSRALQPCFASKRRKPRTSSLFENVLLPSFGWSFSARVRIASSITSAPSSAVMIAVSSCS
jgi:hypothetical protein